MEVLFESFITGGFIGAMFVGCIVDSLNINQIIASMAVVIVALLIGAIGSNCYKRK